MPDPADVSRWRARLRLGRQGRNLGMMAEAEIFPAPGNLLAALDACNMTATRNGNSL
jgi:hypothetical protein